MDLTQPDSMSVPTYIIYRDVQPGEPYDPAASPVFYPPKDSDELFDALRSKYPHLATHSERMRNAVIEFLLEEREAEAAALNAQVYTPEVTQSMEDTASPWMHQSWPSMSSTTLSSPDMSSLGTPAYMNSPNLSTISKESSPMSLDRMTSVFSLSTSLQPKQRLRRKMTEAEKAEYRQRRLMKACDKCAKRKRKCTHNQITADASTSKSAKAAKTSVPASQEEIAAEADSGINHPEAQNADAQASSQAGPSHAEGFNDFTLLLDEPMPEIDYSNMFNSFSDLDYFNHHNIVGRTQPWFEDQTPDEIMPYPHHLLGPLDENGLPTHISPTLLDTATRNNGQIRLHTLQDQIRQQNRQLHRLQEAAHIELDEQQAPMGRAPEAPSFAAPFNRSSTGNHQHYTLVPGRHPSRGHATVLPALAVATGPSTSLGANSAPTNNATTSSDCGGLSTSSHSSISPQSTCSTTPTQSSSNSTSSQHGHSSSKSASSQDGHSQSNHTISTSSSPTVCSVFDHSVERLYTSPTELFMLRRRSHFAPAQRPILQVRRAPLLQDQLTCESTTGDGLASQPSLQHVGRLSDHFRVRDHHGRSVLQILATVLLSMLTSCFSFEVAALVAALGACHGLKRCLNLMSAVGSAMVVRDWGHPTLSLRIVGI